MEIADRELQRVFDIQEKIADLHPCLGHVYPIAVAENNDLVIYDTDATTGKYRLVSKVPAPVKLPEKVRAAFPIESYDCKIACVVTGDAFASLDGYALIFHEFVHCYQFEECELELKKSLKIAREAQAKGNFSWELDYPFPYVDSEFFLLYSSLLQALEDKNLAEVIRCRQELRSSLEDRQFEYMVWQEWKEGFARFMENKIRTRLGIAPTMGEDTPPFSRTVFYNGGAKLIEFLEQIAPDTVADLRKLFVRLMQTEND